MTSLNDLNILKSVLAKLNAEKPAAHGQVGQTGYQNRDGDLLQRLRLEALSQEGNARVLLTGQIGVGKSSELWHFFWQGVSEKTKTGFWAYCDLEKQEYPEKCGATGVLLTIFRDCWGATRNLIPQLYPRNKKRIDSIEAFALCHNWQCRIKISYSEASYRHREKGIFFTKFSFFACPPRNRLPNLPFWPF
jgi:hypothetical protein